MATSCPVYPDLNQLSLVRVDLSLPQIVERRPDFCSDKQGGLAFKYICREESGAPDEGPRKNVVENGLMAKGDTEVVFRPDNKSECLQTLERRSEEHTSELQSLMRRSYAVFCLKKKKTRT